MKSSRFVNEDFIDKGPVLMPDEVFQISGLTRRNLYDELILAEENSAKRISGRLDLTTFLKRIWPLEQMPSTDSRFENAEGDIWQHMINNSDWDYYYLFNYLGLTSGPDENFLRFVEELTHPVVRPPEQQEELVNLINKHLEKDGFKLQAVDQISGHPVFRAVRIGLARVQGKVKNLIFAADGPKPEIVLDDSISNNILVVKNEEHCLVYDVPIPNTGLKWVNLVEWWGSRINQNPPALDIDRDLYKRLNKSIGSEPEGLFFRTYYEQLRAPEIRSKLPALIPQVYLHYDPYTLKELQGVRRLSRQRMDFLILFSNYERIVIEIDGKQHYSTDDKPSPEKYSEMVSSDRKLRLSGYEVYRFGGLELQGENGKAIVENFIRELFKKHSVV
jgi:very-short-patch-repair endonuclease